MQTTELGRALSTLGLDRGVQRRLGWLGPTHDVMHGKREAGASSAPIISLWGDDFDGDGLLDLAFGEGLNLELWHNRGEDGFATIPATAQYRFRWPSRW